MYEVLHERFRSLRDATGIRAVVISGADGDFCSGGDVVEIIGPLVERDAAGRQAFTKMTGDVVRVMRDCPQPIVAAVSGVAAGAGAALALAADVRFGTPDCRFAFLFSRVGLAAADMGVSVLLPRVLGMGRASELLFTGREVAAEEALAVGLLNRVVPADSLLPEALALAHEIAGGPALAHAQTKRILQYAAEHDLAATLDEESRVQAELMGNGDFARAYRAFVERRQAEFRGD